MRISQLNNFKHYFKILNKSKKFLHLIFKIIIIINKFINQYFKIKFRILFLSSLNYKIQLIITQIIFKIIIYMMIKIILISNRNFQISFKKISKFLMTYNKTYSQTV